MVKLFQRQQPEGLLRQKTSRQQTGVAPAAVDMAKLFQRQQPEGLLRQKTSRS